MTGAALPASGLTLPDSGGMDLCGKSLLADARLLKGDDRDMKPHRLFVAGLSLAIGLAAAAGAVAADKPAVSKDQRDKGMAAAPGLISAGGFDCQLADARLIGQGKDAKSKAKTTIYELACTGNEGLIVEQVEGVPAPQSFTCAQAADVAGDSKGAAACILPGNADPKAGLLPYIAKAGKPCVPEKVRALGQSPTNAVFELACQGGAGYILAISAPPRLDKPATMDPCAAYPADGDISCKLTDRAAQLAVVDRLMAKTGKPCQIKDRAWVGSTSSGLMIWEAACADGKGYMIEAKPDGTTTAIDCAAADTIGNGCKLTDARQAKTEQNALYTRLAAKAGFQCQVSGYALLPANIRNREVVEIRCANRPDGGIGVFGATEADPSIVYDCAHSEIEGYRCALTKASAASPSLTADLKKLGKNTCQVSNSRLVGLTPDHAGAFVEVACADGLQGYMVEYTVAPLAPKSVTVCSEAKGIAGGCTLPGNTK